MSVKTYSLAREGGTALSPHFRVREFACNDGSDTVKVDTALVELLEQLREAAGGGAVLINSGYRTKAYNKKVGGASRSQHLLGTAADIQIAGVSPLLAGQMAEFFLGERGGIGVYQTFTHVDVRSGKSRWDQRGGKQVVVPGWPGWKPKDAPAQDNIPSPAHQEGVDWAVEQGLLTGNREGDLMLSQPVTRQQLATILHRYGQLRETDSGA